MRQGETLGLVGESGCGKSTTGRAIVQVERATSGKIRFGDTELTALSRGDLRTLRTQVQMIFQDPISSLNPRRRVSDIVAEPLTIWKIGTKEERRRDRQRDARAVGIDPYLNGGRRPREFSGGQCQRISIARALVLKPKLLVCDEIVSALDVSVQAQILNLLEDLKQEYNLTILFIAHDLAVVKNVSDRVAVMYLGRLCEIAPSDILYEAPAHHYTAALLASAVEPDPEAPRTSVPLVGRAARARSTRRRAAASAPAARGPRPAAPRRSPRCGRSRPATRWPATSRSGVEHPPGTGRRPPQTAPGRHARRPRRRAGCPGPRRAGRHRAAPTPRSSPTRSGPSARRSLGDLSAASPNRPVVAMASTADGGGYWLVASDGGVFSYGDAAFHGSTGGLTLAQPIVGMAADPATGGYWLVASDGGVFAFGAPVRRLARAASPSTSRSSAWRRRRTAAATGSSRRDGGIFSFGDAAFHGSEGGQPLNAPVVGMAATADGGGYWLVASDGGIFSFGDAAFHGSTGGLPLNAPVVGMAATGDGGGYWLVALDGGVFNFGDAPFDGSALSGRGRPGRRHRRRRHRARARATGSPTAACRAPFGPAVARATWRSGPTTSPWPIYDADTGVTWDLNPGQVQVTASIVKVDVMADALAADQRSGGIPPQQAALMPPMIEVSDNNAATSMWGIIGGAAGLAAFDRVLGLQSTTPYPGPITPTNLGWAYTTTSADDMVKVVRTFAFPNADPVRPLPRLRALAHAQRRAHPGLGRPGRGAAGQRRRQDRLHHAGPGRRTGQQHRLRRRAPGGTTCSPSSPTATRARATAWRRSTRVANLVFDALGPAE